MQVEHLDYGYIGKCSDVKYLEKMVRVLRSGTEGLFPDLTEFAENRLRTLSPTSKLLNVAQPIKNKLSLDSQERETLSDDLSSFLSQIKIEDSNDVTHKDKISTVSNSSANSSLPIRGANCVISTDSKVDLTNQKSAKDSERIKSGDYRAWDKFDVDGECDKMDREEEAKPASVNAAPSKLPSENVVLENIPDSEVQRRANIEKEKAS